MKQEIKACQNCKKEFVIEPEDFDFYEKISVPPPTWCPECRLQRRLAYRNERVLYRRKCDFCNKTIVSNFTPDTPYPVYCPPCWWSDEWDAIQYGRNYNPRGSFWSQFFELRNQVPQQARAVSPTTLIHSEYCHMAMNLKNCYLVTHSNNIENTFYSSAAMYVKDSGELLSCQECELCLEDVNCFKCNKVYFSLDCESCYNVAFSRNCVGCSDCFGCVNLRNKQYQIFNRQCSRDEYFEKRKELDLGSHKIHEKLREQIRLQWQRFPQKYIHGRHNANVTGDYVYHSKNAEHCYDVVYVEDSKYCQYINAKTTAQCYDYTEWGMGAELVYESINCGAGISNSRCNQQSWGEVKNIDYTSFCIASSDLFGCISLRHKQYCILNKQYTREQYEKLLPQIIQNMNAMPYTDKRGRTYRYGDFFPTETSFWGYNETTAQEYFPFTKKEAEVQGYSWTDIDTHRGKYHPTMETKDIPDDIGGVTDAILSEIIGCSACKKSYRFSGQELAFYRNQRIALPRKCYDCRYMSRFAQRNSFRLHPRKCDCGGPRSKNGTYANAASHPHGAGHCPNEFETSYAPDRPEIVYCETCYNAEVV